MTIFWKMWKSFMIYIIREKIIIGNLKKLCQICPSLKIIHPNLITSVRIWLFTPLIAYCLLTQNIPLAIIFWLMGWLTDCVDGAWAEVTGKKTKAGEILDPVADRIFCLTAIVLSFWLIEPASPLFFGLITIILLQLIHPLCYLIIRIITLAPVDLRHNLCGKTKTVIIFFLLPIIWLNCNCFYLLMGLMILTIICSLANIVIHICEFSQKKQVS